MNERWNLDVIYKGFDDPSFACDLQELKNAIAAFIALAENLEEKTPLEGLKEGTALQEKISDLGMKLYEYAMLRQSADARDAEAGSQSGRIMAALSETAGAEAAFQNWVC